MPTHAQLAQRAQRARRDALTMIYHAGSGHPGGSLSAIDLLCYLYFSQMNYRADDDGRDRFCLSKGHACAALYAVGHQLGLVSAQEMLDFRKLGRPLQGHPHVGSTPWVETSTGSLGQGFSAALGMALGLRHTGRDARVYVMVGDGEMQEGEIWEGAMFAAHHKLHRFCAILDYNKLQSDDSNANIMGLEPMVDKWHAFGWHVVEIDGHDFAAMEQAFTAFGQQQQKPTIIIAHTIKGKGVPYMEAVPTWHGSVKMTPDDLKGALAALNLEPSHIEACLSGSIYREEA